MEYRIVQSCKYQGGDYWDWSAWLDGSPDTLAGIESVTWILHPSFPRPRIKRQSRKTGFRLKASGWGTFLLKAVLHKKQGASQVISHMLELPYPSHNPADNSGEASPEHSAPTPGNRAIPYVFLSYASEDARPASHARAALTDLGVRVRDASEIKPGLPFDAAVRKMIRESAGVVSVLGSDYASPYVIAEMKLARAEEKPLLALLPEGVDRPSGLLPDLQELRFSLESNQPNVQLEGFVASLRPGGGG